MASEIWDAILQRIHWFLLYKTEGKLPVGRMILGRIEFTFETYVQYTNWTLFYVVGWYRRVEHGIINTLGIVL